MLLLNAMKHNIC